MTNFEKYKDILLNMKRPFALEHGKPVECFIASLSCADCDLCKSKPFCSAARIKWLYKDAEEIDWATLPVDTKILVSNGGDWYKRYFAAYENDRVYVFTNGRSSFTADKNDFASWKYAKLYEGEE